MSAKAFCICRRLLLPGLAVLLTLLLCLSAWLLADGGPSLLRATPATPDIRTNAVTGSLPFRCVVIDAGHGGEDGGAQSADGLLEKDVNLSVALCLRDYLEAAGIPTVLTRTQDKLLYDPAGTIGAGKRRWIWLPGWR